MTGPTAQGRAASRASQFWNASQGFARRGWVLPYATVLAVAVSEGLGAPTNIGSFFALAPLLASRLLGRLQVALSGIAAFVVEMFLFLSRARAEDRHEDSLILALIVVATLIAMITQEVHARDTSTLGRASGTVRLATSLLAGVDPEEAHHLLATSARTLYGAALTGVYRPAGDRMLLVASDHEPTIRAPHREITALRFPGAFGVTMHLADSESMSAAEAAMLGARGLRSLLWLPLVERGESIGVLAIAWRGYPPLNEGDLDASWQFAQLAARAIFGSERARSQAEVLDQVQELLLSPPPAWMHGWAVQVRYQSASELARIGGDFYDVIEVDHGGVAFIVADARGKGLEASSLAAILKGGFRTLAGEGLAPGRVLERLDPLVAREGGDEDFVTALVGQLGADGTVVLASAGHPLPYGVSIPHLVPSAPLGLGSAPRDAVVQLQPGERLVCYTDGLIEARDADGVFIDTDRLAVMAAVTPLDAALSALVDAVDTHASSGRRDDLALLGVEYQPEGEAR